jgi:hypothetical protein
VLQQGGRATDRRRDDPVSLLSQAFDPRKKRTMVQATIRVEADQRRAHGLGLMVGALPVLLHC